jgi:transcriptional antiterminator
MTHEYRLATECVSHGPVPNEEQTLENNSNVYPGIINTLLTCSEYQTPADLAEVLGVSESWLLADFSNAYELLSMFCYITGSELTINRRVVA